MNVDEMRGTITVHKTDSSNEPPKTFTFDTVFGPESKQLDVYNLTARPIIDSVLEGYNGKSLVARKDPILSRVLCFVKIPADLVWRSFTF